MFTCTVHLKQSSMGGRYVAVVTGVKVYHFGMPCRHSEDQMEVSVFNTVTLSWVTFPPVTGTGRGEVPSARWMHTAVLIEDIAYIWGGLKCKSLRCCNVLYAFDVDTHTWFKPRDSGTVPGARKHHSACALRKIMYIFGGDCTNGIYMLDTNTMVWSSLNSKSPCTPSALPHHSATIIGTTMFVFAGHEGYRSAIAAFNTETNNWMYKKEWDWEVRPLNIGHKCHTAFAYNGELYLYGGDVLDTQLNYLWKYTPKTWGWEKVELKGKGPSQMTWMCCCMVGDRLVLLGHSDLYVLDLSPSLKTLCELAVVQYGLEQSGLPHNIRWELAAMNGNNLNAIDCQ